MLSVPFTEVRANLADTLRDVESGQEPVLISRRGQTAGVLMSWAQYRRLTEGASDFEAALKRWRTECMPEPRSEIEETPEADPFANLRDPDPGRTYDWPSEE